MIREPEESDPNSPPKTWHEVKRLDTETAGGNPDTAGGDLAFEALIGERIIAVFRHQGSWFAMDAMCSHQGGPLAEGVVKDGCVTCPWHGWQYDLATGVQLINKQPLQETFQVRESDGIVEVLA
ncbi:Ferredoxin subunit of nitrite reductase or a ring-hydroxylating dioxygenase [Neorhodopirellula lusitana]|uniref:Ferredoxin subunit of nitrite reductase or a ring-hydroxylating dioxygenase n=1 Tax=Neorhodopirellula lusitana TaxID=445327 RepID=A0ABY1QQ86_9BACT|nr:Rieske (2Fe-2S) protein [Neorhodopirellula lusitana]SMP77966.1 Ferredoxin subunit of nitrite reductase or a ring-hydroxylating dioxygenase [Neorhodopirellula lusitana]